MRLIAFIAVVLAWMAGAAPAHSSANASSAAYSAAALYNTANADARAGRRGLAVLRYERALLLAPGDADIDANLHLVQKAARVSASPPRPGERILSGMSHGLLAWLGLLGVAAAGGGVLAWRWRKTHRRSFAALTVAGVLAMSLAVVDAAGLWPAMDRAVVVAPSAPVRVSPVDFGDPLFTLSEANEVTLRGRHDGFWLIRTAEGKSGWVSADSVSPLVPDWRP